MVSRMLLDGRLSILLPVLGIIGGVLGGWVLTLIFGIAEKVLFLSLISALVGAALMLWFVAHIAKAGKRKAREEFLGTDEEHRDDKSENKTK